MSTTIKRIALVAVAALGLSIVSVAPSQATTNSVLTFGSGDAAGSVNSTGFGVAGAFNFATVNVTSAAADYVLTTDSTFVGQGDASPVGTLSPDAKSLSMSDTGVTGIRVATPSVGTVTVRYWVRTGGVLAATAAETVVITVNATKQSGIFSAANSTVFMVAGETNTAFAATADAVVTGLGTANIETATATIAVTLRDALKAAIDDTITATVISGGANVRLASRAESVTAIAETVTVTAGTFSASKMTTSGQALVFVHANGTSGPAVIRITNSAGTEIGRETVTFSSTTVASLAATVVFGNINGTKNGAVTVIARDASNNIIPGASITAESSDTTKISSPSAATTDSTGKATFNVTAPAAASGAATLTFKSGTATTTASVRAAGVLATKLTITPSATSAEAGSKVTYTLEVADAAGALADGDYVAKFFTGAPVTSNGGTGAFATDTITVLNGKATSEVFVPFISGNYSQTWTLKGTAGGAATADLSAALVGTKITVDVAVTNASADAALDAANEAATAAQDATDAAIQAADAADEAIAAVAALSLEVNALVAGLKKQLTTLTNLVKNLQKAVAKK